MEITLLTVLFAGLQTDTFTRGRIPYLLVCPNRPTQGIFQSGHPSNKATVPVLVPLIAWSQPDITWNDNPAYLPGTPQFPPC